MAFFKNLFTSIKNAFGGEDNEKEENGLAKQRDTLSSYQSATMQQPAAPAIQHVQTQTTEPTAPPPKQPVPVKMPTQPTLTEVSEIVEHEVINAPGASLDILVDSLGLNRKKIVCDRGVVSIPFDASGCDFETKRQVAQAVAKEFNLITNALPTNIACTEAAKRAFSSIKAAREECFVCGMLLLSINQDIDDEGYMLAEVTNTHNGNAVFFDIPATILSDGSVDVNYDLIAHNVLVCRDKTI
ncbi:MAG: hypothetical protein IJZ68_07185 [Bacteroidaceae bacterium]|nr:hypothetical protein [Bacteroidaceae bacterium]